MRLQLALDCTISAEQKILSYEFTPLVMHNLHNERGEIMREYSVYLDEKSVGKALFTKEGMYQRVRCDCKLPKDQCYHAFIKTPEGHVPL